ncbi:50S ribosomal protein L31 [Candidatus Blochmanniella floridana]|uniref:Large ribosomal subunit protein bL31 n=1 Tax=Blochmanniella floridana TaxID=203907 RepID=RL31_BLOFL|nr:RecName: Full=Large ribosomal subunit protein bL31; AltName: Full=50S ribosomal protein L31 [Candidatus Blochmannia floridanus]CAD83274.1 50S ribosomal protein L31 [Candidatus Blochmannia floridanus]
MKKNIHPQYNVISASCSCGNVIHVRSTLKHNINLDVCDACHPFYTGTQRIIDTRGRVNLFNKRFNKNNKNPFI